MIWFNTGKVRSLINQTPVLIPWSTSQRRQPLITKCVRMLPSFVSQPSRMGDRKLELVAKNTGYRALLGLYDGPGAN